jgi:hypothetical protein
MKKLTLLTPVLLSLFALPLFASAETLSVPVGTSASTTVEVSATATEAQLMTACAQNAIDARDSSIGSARSAYNNAMTVALDARKEAEKKAIALEDNAKKDAIKAAVDSYKKAVLQAQDTLTSARKEAWAAFEANTNTCRDTSKIGGAGAKASSSLRTMQADAKSITDDKKTIKDVIDALKSFFKLGGSATGETK